MIQSLSYIGFRSPNSEDWLDFGPSILGLELAGRGADGAVRLRVDDALHRITIHPGPANDLAYLGWAVADPGALDATIAHLEKAQVVVHRAEAELARERAVVDLAWFLDPFGFRHEISWGLAARPSSFRPGRAMSGFVTGAGGLGHVVLIVPDLQRAERFYAEALGLRLSDRIDAGMSVRFFHCNRRHHTLALASVPGLVGMHHLMLEVASLDDVGTALDICNRQDIPITMSLGRHTNDHMTSFYLRGPSGFEIEYGFGGVLIEDQESWVAGSYDAMSIWGHKPPAKPVLPGIIRPFAPAGASA
uniref:2,3-dihydroxybiphenyl dioxygenase n=1 Tax=uncultured bacterium UPO76 TaxID=1776993 RepID=A0A140DZY0_9BACT|nr:2,3-dihydroxybiphenyl dioxygenase [uncultured bacterium UPO76]